MSFMKTAYDRLPVWAQNAVVNVFSVRNARLKYGPVFHETLNQLARNETQPLSQLLESQSQALKNMLTYAKRHVPYYRAIDCPSDDLSAWPIIKKQVVKEHPDQFLSDEFQPQALMTFKTSGTTGTPLQVRITREFHQMEMAFRWRHKAWAGVPYLSRGAYVAGHSVVPGDQTHPPFWRMDAIERRLLCSSYHLNWNNIPSYVDAIMQYRPDFIHGYPSSLFLLSKFILQEGGGTIRPKAVFTSSETLMDYQRSSIEAAFGAPAFNYYGQSELTCNIIQCAKNALHYRTDYGVLEVLDDGTMVCTGLINRAMPLIRYRVGDRVSMGGDTCTCGCHFPVVERLEGRMEDYVVTPDGRFVGRLDHLLKDVQHVREAQIVQKTEGEVVLRVVPTEAYSFRDEHAILSEARARLGSLIKIHFDYVDAIPRDPSGKFRFILSKLPARVRKANSLTDPTDGTMD